MDERTQQELTVIKEGIKQDAPRVAEFFAVDTPLHPYAKQLEDQTAPPVHRERQKLLKAIVRKELRDVFSEAEIDAANVNWETDWKINIVDHHGLLNHPILVSANIVGNIHKLPAEKPEGIVVLSDSGVPFNNFFHKRGLKFQGQQINLFPHSTRHKIAWAAKPSETFPIVEAAKDLTFSERERAFLSDTQTSIETEVLPHKYPRFIQQISRANAFLWIKLFAPELRASVPELLYVPNEDVCIRLLEHYLTDPNNLFSRILSKEHTRSLVLNAFSGMIGCWSADGSKGSEFFWGVNDRQENFPLRVAGDRLISLDHPDFSVELTQEAILEALHRGVMYPTMFLVYGVSVFHCGIVPLVGYASMNYQTAMKKAWVQVLREIDPAEANLVETIPTNSFIGGPIATFAWEPSSGYRSLSALDLIYRGGMTETYLTHLRDMPFNKLLQSALLDVYDSYVRPEHKQPITITTNDLLEEEFSWIKEVWT